VVKLEQRKEIITELRKCKFFIELSPCLASQNSTFPSWGLGMRKNGFPTEALGNDIPMSKRKTNILINQYYSYLK